MSFWEDIEGGARAAQKTHRKGLGPGSQVQCRGKTMSALTQKVRETIQAESEAGPIQNKNSPDPPAPAQVRKEEVGTSSPWIHGQSLNIWVYSHER